MAVVEMMFKVNDSPDYATDPGSHWKDGMPIECKGPGQLFDSLELQQYFVDETLPSNFSQLLQCEQDIFLRRLQQTKWLTDPARTPEDLVAVREGIDLADAARMIAESEGERFLMETYGLDTNWGWNDLCHHGVIRVEMAYKRGAMGEVVPPFVMTDHVFAKRRNLRIRRRRAKYENYFNPGKLSNLRDPAKWVQVNRAQTPVPVADLMELVTDPV